jgi:hypothetical protein
METYMANETVMMEQDDELREDLERDADFELWKTKVTIWKSITKERHAWIRDCVFPAAHEPSLNGFLCGEQVTADPETDGDKFTAVAEIDGKFYETVDPITLRKFQQLTREQVELEVEASRAIAICEEALRRAGGDRTVYVRDIADHRYPVIGHGGAVVGHVTDDDPSPAA